MRPMNQGRSAGSTAAFVEGEDVVARGGAEREVGVLDALGDAAEGDEGAEVVLGEKGVELAVGDVRVDGHA